MRSVLLWDIMQLRVVIPYRRFRKTNRSHKKIQDSSISWIFNMGPIGYPESSVRNCHYTLRNISEERIFYVLLVLKNHGAEEACRAYCLYWLSCRWIKRFKKRTAGETQTHTHTHNTDSMTMCWSWCEYNEVVLRREYQESLVVIR